jgi:archaellum biogenesis protein FlaJ (TadC family)
VAMKVTQRDLGRLRDAVDELYEDLDGKSEQIKMVP